MMRNSNSSNNTTNNNNTNSTNRYVTVRDPNKVPRVEKVVYDNRIKRKNVLALNEKVAAIREYEKRPIYKRIGRMFQCSPDQIKRIVQQKETILNAWEQRTRKCRDAKTLEMKVVRVSMLGKAVYEWIRRMMYYKDILITDGLIQKMALQFKSAMGLQNFFPHQEWCDKFRSTYKIFICDSKTLNIAYTQGHSVQIKDVMKDVLSECCPNEEGEDDHDTEDGDDLEDDCMSIDSDEEDNGGGVSQNNQNVREKLKSKLLTKDNSKTVVYPKPTTIQTMQGLRQLVALPLQGNGMPGMGQKVLVATPIVQPGQKQGSGPMTMTIIPLATLGQPQNNINTTAGALNQGSYTQTFASRNDNNNNDDIPIPTPIMEMKLEIKEEPKDEDDHMIRIGSSIEEEDSVKIKKEYITDDEENCCSQPNKQMATTTISHLPTLLPAHVVSIPLHNRDMLEESSKDSMDDLTLSSLRKRIKTEENSADTYGKNESRDKSSEQNNGKSSHTESRSASNMPPMPPLIKAPTLNATSTPPTATSSMANCHSVDSTNKSDTHNHQSSPDLCSNSKELPAISTCSEARKYLKLLEDFALERENFRLIGLITRADEVLRELDRKDNSDGDNEDVDVD